MDYSTCSCPYLSQQLPWYEPDTYEPSSPTPRSRFQSQSRGAGKRPKVYIPTGAYTLPKPYYPIEAYDPTRRYYPRRAYYPANYGPRSFLRAPDFYPPMPWYAFYGVGPYPYGTYDPDDAYGGDYEPEDNEEVGGEGEDEDDVDEDEGDDGEEGSTHTTLAEHLEGEDDVEEGLIDIVTEPVEVIPVEMRG